MTINEQVKILMIKLNQIKLNMINIEKQLKYLQYLLKIWRNMNT